MMTLIFAPFLLALDGFVVCTALGPQEYVRSRRGLMAAAFGLCDASAIVMGAMVGNQSTREALALANHAAPFLIATYGLCVAVGVFGGHRLANRGEKCVFLLPVIMSIDNFTAGLALGHSPSAIFALAVTVMSVSSTMAFVGLQIGSALVERVRIAPIRFSTVGLVLAALGSWRFL